MEQLVLLDIQSFIYTENLSGTYTGQIHLAYTSCIVLLTFTNVFTRLLFTLKIIAHVQV